METLTSGSPHRRNPSVKGHPIALTNAGSLSISEAYNTIYVSLERQKAAQLTLKKNMDYLIEASELCKPYQAPAISPSKPSVSSGSPSGLLPTTPVTVLPTTATYGSPPPSASPFQEVLLPSLRTFTSTWVPRPVSPLPPWASTMGGGGPQHVGEQTNGGSLGSSNPSDPQQGSLQSHLPTGPGAHPTPGGGLPLVSPSRLGPPVQEISNPLASSIPCSVPHPQKEPLVPATHPPSVGNLQMTTATMIVPPTPKVSSGRPPPKSVHCLCGFPVGRGFLIACDGCERWFHGACVSMDFSSSEWYQTWYCPSCIPQGRIPLRRRACLFAGCKQPIIEPNVSGYCSTACHSKASMIRAINARKRHHPHLSSPSAFNSLPVLL